MKRLRWILGCGWLLFAALASPAPARAADSWEATIERVSQGVVALRVSATRAFDTENASVTLATGFVVDGERGLILTNRHVVQPGPIIADAMFLNHEKLPVWPLYRDPVHDFGFFRFDPKAVRFMQPSVLRLAPEAAKVGVEIRVIGNDSGEKLSILAGTIARLDREAPEYGRGSFNDFNTFYMQAASSSSGGSSGSPVVDRSGRVVGLNAGGNARSASSFFLPLPRVARALQRLQAGLPVARGSLQAVFSYESYDELRRLGLAPETEARMRKAFPHGIGLLVAREVSQGGPADGKLEPGDVLVALGGRPLADFAELEAVLDDAVGASVTLSVERGGERKELSIEVGDLHAITPASFLEFGGAVVNPLSYQIARSFAVPVRGLYLASAGYVFGQAGIPSGMVITQIDDAPVPDLAALERELAARPHGSYARVRAFHLLAPKSPRASLVRIDRRWHPARHCDRNDASGLWDCRELAPAPPAPAPTPASTQLEPAGSRVARKLAASVALVNFEVPYVIDGVQGTSFSGAGLVVDAERGLVLVDRDTVPVTLGDVQLVFGGAVSIPGRVVGLHPEHNLAAVAYDPALLGTTPVRSAEWNTEALAPGDELTQVVLTPRQQLLTKETVVERIDAPSLPLPATPRFREVNLDLISLADSSNSVGGVLADGRGRVRGLWASFSTDADGKVSSFFAGIPAETALDWVNALRRGDGGSWHTLGIEIEPVPIATARLAGLPDALAHELEASDPERRRVLAVRRLAFGAHAAELLQVGDFLVRAEGKTLTNFRTAELAAQGGVAHLTAVRGGELLEVAVESRPVTAFETERLVRWNGALLQAVPAFLALQRGLSPDGVYVAGRFRGSPAERDQLAPTLRVLAVDEVETPDLDSFLARAEKSPDRAVRLRVAELDGRVRILTLEPDAHYWPTSELRRGPDGWERHDGAVAAQAAR